MISIKHSLISSLFAVLATCAANGEIVNISSPSSSLLLDAEKGKSLKFLYYGKKLIDNDITVIATTAAKTDFYPVYGLGNSCKTALAATMPDGNMTLDIAVDTVVTDGAVTSIRMSDKLYPWAATSLSVHFLIAT